MAGIHASLDERRLIAFSKLAAELTRGGRTGRTAVHKVVGRDYARANPLHERKRRNKKRTITRA